MISARPGSLLWSRKHLIGLIQAISGKLGKPTTDRSSFSGWWRPSVLRRFVDTAELRYPNISALNEAINEKFSAAGICVAFPQRDLYLDTILPLQVELRRVDGQAGV